MDTNSGYGAGIDQAVRTWPGQGHGHWVHQDPAKRQAFLRAVDTQRRCDGHEAQCQVASGWLGCHGRGTGEALPKGTSLQTIYLPSWLLLCPISSATCRSRRGRIYL